MATDAKSDDAVPNNRLGVRLAMSPVVVLDDEGGQANGTLRSQDQIVEVYEVEIKKKGEWVPPPKNSWTHKNGTEYLAPEDIELAPNYTWITNWRIDETPGEGQKDRHGWEYASKQARFSVSRIPRATKRSDKARRRRWMRVMVPEHRVKLFESERDERLLRQIQQNLERLQTARVQIETALERHHGKLPSNQASCVAAFKKNIQSLSIRLNTMDHEISSGPEPPANTTAAVLKKLRNDLRREEGLFQRLADRLEAAEQSSDSKQNSSSLWAAASSSASAKKPVSPSSPTVPTASVVSSPRSGGFSAAAAAAGGATAPPKKSVTGKQGAFDPSALISKHTTSQDEEGVFVLRQDREDELWQKFIPQDELTVQSKIIEERDEEIQAIYRGMLVVNEAFKDLQEIVNGQAEDLVAIYENADVAHERAKEGYEQIVEAARIQAQGNCIIS